MNRELTTTAHIGFLGLIVVLFLFAVLSYRNTNRISQAEDWVRQTDNVSLNLQRLLTTLRNSESAIRGYLLTGDSSMLAPHQEAIKDGPRLLETIAASPEQHSEQRLRLNAIGRKVNKALELHQAAVSARMSDDEAAARRLAAGPIRSQGDEVRDALIALQKFEADRLDSRLEELRASRQFAIVSNLLTTLAAILTVVAIYSLNARYLKGRGKAAALIFAERERLRVTLNSIGDGVVATDDLGRVTFLNAVAEQLCGWTTQDAMHLPIDVIFRVIDETTREEAPNPIRRVLETGVMVGRGRHSLLVSRHGQESAIDDSAAPIRDSSGQLIGVVLILREIGAHREREKQLVLARHAAERANRSKSEFLANMSHEIRTPMAAILGYADLLQMRQQDDYAKNCISVIKRNGQFLLDIINDILDLSRIEAGRLEVERQSFRVETVLQDVISMMQVRAQEKQITLGIENPGDVSLTIESDPVRIRQILVNLIGNAIKFTEQGGVRIAVSMTGDPGRRQLRIRVVDTGIGMTSEQQAGLFQPFSQGDGSINRRYGGTGLGLTISKRLAAMLGGDIEVRSEVNVGSEFTLVLEAPERNDSPRATPQPNGRLELPSEAPTSVTLAGRFLVVDDRRDVRYLAQDLLARAGAEVETADDGQQAMTLVQQRALEGRPFRMVLMDMQMPVVDGYEATRRLRASGFRLPIIALTAGAMTGDREKCLEAGCDGYLSKPIDRKQLLAVVLSQLAPGEQAAYRFAGGS